MEGAGQLQALKEQPEENGARSTSPIRMTGQSKEVEERLLPSAMVMEVQELANNSRPPTPDVVDKGIPNMEVDNQTEANGPTQALREPEGIDGVTIQEKDLITFSQTQDRGPASPPAVG